MYRQRRARNRSEASELEEQHALAMEKVRIWQQRAVIARSAGRVQHAERCDDKVRDWMSKAKQFERRGKHTKSGR